MSLALLPSDHIMRFHQTNLHPSRLPESYREKAKIVILYQYVERYWSKLVDRCQFSGFGAKLRTNAAVESFNTSLKNRFESYSGIFSLSDITDLRHQSRAMCIIMLGGEDTHPPVVCNESREPQTSHYPSRSVTKKITNKLPTIAVDR